MARTDYSSTPLAHGQSKARRGGRRLLHHEPCRARAAAAWAKATLAPADGLWIAWPKRRRPRPTSLAAVQLRADTGLVDNKSCIDDDGRPSLRLPPPTADSIRRLPHSRPGDAAELHATSLTRTRRARASVVSVDRSASMPRASASASVRLEADDVDRGMPRRLTSSRSRLATRDRVRALGPAARPRVAAHRLTMAARWPCRSCSVVRTAEIRALAQLQHRLLRGSASRGRRPRRGLRLGRDGASRERLLRPPAAETSSPELAIAATAHLARRVAPRGLGAGGPTLSGARRAAGARPATARPASSVIGVTPECDTHTIRSASGGAIAASSACTARPPVWAAWNDVPQPVNTTRAPSGSRRSRGTDRSQSG